MSLISHRLMSLRRKKIQFIMMAGRAMQMATEKLEMQLRALNFISRGNRTTPQIALSEEGT